VYQIDLGDGVHDSGWAPEIPLGPFEGALITAYGAGKHRRDGCPDSGSVVQLKPMR
jgi:hypothetical protein